MRWFVLALAACGSGSSTPPTQQPPPPPPADAAVVAFDAAEHEDTHGSVFPRIPTRAPKPIDIVLYSSPVRATVSVDGRVVGRTPTYWAGEADGLEHEFLFVEPGYADARYLFIPITSGTVHAKLEQLPEGARDAGAPTSSEPKFTPDAAPLPPIDAAPRVESRPPPRPAPDAAVELAVDAAEPAPADAAHAGPEP